MSDRDLALVLRQLINSCADCPCWKNCRKQSRGMTCTETIEEWLKQEAENDQESLDEGVKDDG